MLNQAYIERDLRALHMRDERAKPIGNYVNIRRNILSFNQDNNENDYEAQLSTRVQQFDDGRVRVNVSPPRPSTPTNRGRLHIRYSGKDAITFDTHEGKPTITVKVGNRSRPPSPGLPTPNRSPSPAQVSPTVSKHKIFREEIITPIKHCKSPGVPIEVNNYDVRYSEGAPSQLVYTVPIGIRRISSAPNSKMVSQVPDLVSSNIREIPIQRATFTSRKDVLYVARKSESSEMTNTNTKTPSPVFNLKHNQIISSPPTSPELEQTSMKKSKAIAQIPSSSASEYVNIPTSVIRHPSPPRVLTPKSDLFTDDENNEDREYFKTICCLPDFYGICVKCKKAVIGIDSGCSALDQIYHNSCFKCLTCEIELQGLPFYCLDKQAYCETCYVNTLEKCCQCKKPISDRIVRATGKPFHPSCFSCVSCGKSLDGIPFTVDASNRIYCINDFHSKFAPRCYACSKPIIPPSGSAQTIRVVAMDKSFHVDCYKCHDCKINLSSDSEGKGCYPLDDLILCQNCNTIRIQRLTSNITTEL